MIDKTIRTSFRAPLLTTLLVAAGAAIGTLWMQDLRRDVFPDLSAPVFNVIAQNAAMGAEELETAIAIPLEVELAGLPEVRRIRSNSQLGVAQVTVEFEPDADYYRSRQFVAELDLLPLGQPHQAEQPALRHEDLTARVFVAAMLVNREGWNHEHVVGAERIGFAVVDLPTSAAQAEQSRRADMAVRAPRGSFGLNVRVMGREIENRRALENIVADNVTGLVRAAAAHHRALHGKQLHHARQLLFDRRFMALVREWVRSLKTLLRLPGPPFFHF